MCGFFFHLLKVACIWSNDHKNGLAAVPHILSQIVDRDIPLMRQRISMVNRLLIQMYRGVSLPFYDDQLFEPVPPACRLAHEFRREVLVEDAAVSKVLKLYEKSLNQIFLLLCDKTTQMFEYEKCDLVSTSLKLSSFRLRQQKQATRKNFKKIVAA